jgi:phosphate butyryltransferase
MMRTFSDIEKKVRELPSQTVVVPAAANTCILQAAITAKRGGIANFILIDTRSRLEATLEELGESKDLLSQFEVIEEEDCVKAAAMGVAIVREGRASLIGKGRLQTFELMKAVLDKTTGIREDDSLLSDIMLIEQPLSDEPRLIGLSDPALCVSPSEDDLVRITRNCMKVMRGIGCSVPRVALLAALEVEKKSMPVTEVAAAVARRLNNGEVENVVAEGPLSFDIACSPRCARLKGRNTPVAGNADLLIVPTIETGNVIAKAVAVFTKAQYGHLVTGARVPVVMSSRADASRSKYNSILLGLLAVS